jgi:hypothetical protein
MENVLVRLSCNCDKIPDINSRGRVCSGSQFQRVRFIVLDSTGSVPTVRQNIMAVGANGGGGCSPHGGQEAESNTKGPRVRCALQRHTPVT